MHSGVFLVCMEGTRLYACMHVSSIVIVFFYNNIYSIKKALHKKYIGKERYRKPKQPGGGEQAQNAGLPPSPTEPKISNNRKQNSCTETKQTIAAPLNQNS